LEKRLNAGNAGFVKSAVSRSGFGLPDEPGRPAQVDFAGKSTLLTRSVNACGGLVLTPGLPIPERGLLKLSASAARSDRRRRLDETSLFHRTFFKAGLKAIADT
jgi:hypothetical protein